MTGIQLQKYAATSLLLIVAVLVSSCDGPNEPTHEFYVPKYLSYEALRSGVSVQAPKPPLHPGKALAHANHVYVLDSLSGIHVFDCSNPGPPFAVAFITVPGADGFAITNDVLYAESYIDLLSFDISVPNQPQLRHRRENAFPQLLTESFLESLSLDSGVVMGWERVLGDLLTWEDGMAVVHTSHGERKMRVEAVDPTRYGLQQTNKKFEVVGRQQLAVVTQDQLRILDIGQKWSPTDLSSLTIRYGATSTFVHASRMYISFESDVHSYDVSDPANPSELHWFVYAFPPDRLAAIDKTMYVASRNGSRCYPCKGSLDAFDITDERYSEPSSEHPLAEPNAMQVEGNRLYVCDGLKGLTVFDIANPLAPILSGSYPVMDCYHVALVGTTAVVVAKDGIHFLECANPAAIVEKSVIKAVL